MTALRLHVDAQRLRDRAPPRRLYIASDVRHAAKWRALRAVATPPFTFNMSWIDWRLDMGDTRVRQLLWIACAREAAAADGLILYLEPGETRKGALIEAGAALGAGKPVFQVGTCASVEAGEGSDASFTSHPRWHRFRRLDDVFAHLLEGP